MSAASLDDGLFHLEVRPGWRRMLLAPIDGEDWDDEVLAAPEWLVGQVLRSTATAAGAWASPFWSPSDHRRRRMFCTAWRRF